MPTLQETLFGWMNPQPPPVEPAAAYSTYYPGSQPLVTTPTTLPPTGLGTTYYPGAGVPQGATQTDILAANAAFNTAQGGTTGGTTGLPGLEEPTGEVVVENGYIVPIYRRGDGTTYKNLTEAKPVQAFTQTGQAPTDKFGRQMLWNQSNGTWYYPFSDWNIDPKTQEAGYISPTQQEEWNRQAQQQAQTLSWYREQQASQLASEKASQLAQLRANPASWLEYASLSGETPVIQPWMLPLSPQNYGWQAGQPLPGYQAGGSSLTGLPQLTTPSTQYMARLAPSSRQQYQGYEQARTGQTPEDVQWRLWSQAPPSGQFGGLTYAR